METLDCVVAGAGVIGLAVARALALAGREVVVLEGEGAFGTGTSSRSSEVIHAGIYYPQGSAMARHCVTGRRALYDYCHAHHVPSRRCGKLIVATSLEERDRLPGIAARAKANGVEDLRLLGADAAQAMEAELRVVAAIHSPQTGIVDSHALMVALLGDFESASGMLALNAPVLDGRATETGVELAVGGPEPTWVRCRSFVNAAGHGAVPLARNLAGFPPNLVPRAWFAKGSYFALIGRAPFSQLIYPVPVPGALGIHLTLDLGGQARFGPDIEWVDRPDYEVRPERAHVFYEGIRRYWPGLPDGALLPAYAGLRPKIVSPEVASQDFLIQGPGSHGVPGLVNLFGMESPGLTSCLSIAQEVRDLLGD